MHHHKNIYQHIYILAFNSLLAVAAAKLLFFFFRPRPEGTDSGGSGSGGGGGGVTPRSRGGLPPSSGNGRGSGRGSARMAAEHAYGSWHGNGGANSAGGGVGDGDSDEYDPEGHAAGSGVGAGSSGGSTNNRFVSARRRAMLEREVVSWGRDPPPEGLGGGGGRSDGWRGGGYEGGGYAGGRWSGGGRGRGRGGPAVAGRGGDQWPDSACSSTSRGDDGRPASAGGGGGGSGRGYGRPWEDGSHGAGGGYGEYGRYHEYSRGGRGGHPGSVYPPYGEEAEGGGWRAGSRRERGGGGGGRGRGVGPNGDRVSWRGKDHQYRAPPFRGPGSGGSNRWDDGSDGGDSDEDKDIGDCHDVRPAFVRQGGRGRGGDGGGPGGSTRQQQPKVAGRSLPEGCPEEQEPSEEEAAATAAGFALAQQLGLRDYDGNKAGSYPSKRGRMSGSASWAPGGGDTGATTSGYTKEVGASGGGGRAATLGSVGGGRMGAAFPASRPRAEGKIHGVADDTSWTSRDWSKLELAADAVTLAAAAARNGGGGPAVGGFPSFYDHRYGGTRVSPSRSSTWAAEKSRGVYPPSKTGVASARGGGSSLEELPPASRAGEGAAVRSSRSGSDGDRRERRNGGASNEDDEEGDTKGVNKSEGGTGHRRTTSKRPRTSVKFDEVEPSPYDFYRRPAVEAARSSGSGVSAAASLSEGANAASSETGSTPLLPSAAWPNGHARGGGSRVGDEGGIALEKTISESSAGPSSSEATSNSSHKSSSRSSTDTGGGDDNNGKDVTANVRQNRSSHGSSDCHDEACTSSRQKSGNQKSPPNVLTGAGSHSQLQSPPSPTAGAVAASRSAACAGRTTRRTIGRVAAGGGGNDLEGSNIKDEAILTAVPDEREMGPDSKRRQLAPGGGGDEIVAGKGDENPAAVGRDGATYREAAAAAAIASLSRAAALSEEAGVVGVAGVGDKKTEKDDGGPKPRPPPPSSSQAAVVTAGGK